jgi:tetratricopeptide (TPR) repeat protein
MEAAAEPIDAAKYRLLDHLLDLMTGGLSEETRNAAAFDPKAAAEVLTSVDNVLVEHNFVFPPRDLVDTFGDALTEHQTDTAVLKMIKARGANQRRQGAIDRNDDRRFYYTDGKTSAIFYLAVAELLKIPLYLVEIPGGNFVRWSSGGKQINWDTNNGLEVSDEVYLALSHFPAQLVSSKVYLVNMSRASVDGYWHGVVADRLALRGRYDLALKEYEEGVRLYSISPEQKNNLAWFLATSPDATMRDGKRAIGLASQAVSVWANPNWVDTLAAAYAEAGDWNNAVATELRAEQLSTTLLRSAFYADPWPDYGFYAEAYKQHKSYATLQAEVKMGNSGSPSFRVPAEDVPGQPTQCATDPTYQYFEAKQKKEYLKNPVAKVLLADLASIERTIDEVTKELDQRTNSLAPVAPTPQEDNEFLKKMLRVHLNTCYENRLFYAMITEYIRQIDEARKRLKLPLPIVPKYGTLPIPDINAVTFPSTETTDSIIAFNNQLFSFDYQLTKVVLPTIHVSEDVRTHMVKVDFSQSAADKAIQEKPDTKVNFVMALLEFLLITPPSTRPLDKAYDPLVITFTEGMELFAVGHEYAHVILKHSSPTTPLGLAAGNEYVASDNASSPVLLRSWKQEFDADELSLRLLIETLRPKGEGDDAEDVRWLYKLYGARFFFKCMDMVDRAKYIKDHGRPQPELTPQEKDYMRAVAMGTASNDQKAKFAAIAVDGSHPPAWLRLERLNSAMEKYLAGMPIRDDARAFSQIGVGLLTNVDILWNAVAPRLPIIVQSVEAEAMKKR